MPSPPGAASASFAHYGVDFLNEKFNIVLLDNLNDLPQHLPTFEMPNLLSKREAAALKMASKWGATGTEDECTSHLPPVDLIHPALVIMRL